MRGIVGPNLPLGAVTAANGDGTVFGAGEYTGETFPITGDVVRIIPPLELPPPF